MIITFLFNTSVLFLMQCHLKLQSVFIRDLTSVSACETSWQLHNFIDGAIKNLGYQWAHIKEWCIVNSSHKPAVTLFDSLTTALVLLKIPSTRWPGSWSFIAVFSCLSEVLSERYFSETHTHTHRTSHHRTTVNKYSNRKWPACAVAAGRQRPVMFSISSSPSALRPV